MALVINTARKVAIVSSSPNSNEREGHAHRPREQHHQRRHEDRYLSARADGDGEREVHLVLARHRNCGEVLGSVTEQWQQNDADEHRGHTPLLTSRLDGMHQNLGHQGDQRGRHHQQQHRLALAHRRLLMLMRSIGDEKVGVCAQLEDQEQAVEQQEHHGCGMREFQDVGAEGLGIATPCHVVCGRQDERNHSQQQQ